MSELNNKRIEYVDVAKAFAIVGVICVHLECENILPIVNTFHIITFFIVSGILLNKTKITSFSQYFRKKLKGYLWPYLTMSCCYICIYSIIYSIVSPNKIAEVIVWAGYRTITFSGIGTLWFLPVIFLASIFSFPVHYLSLKKNKWVYFFSIIISLVVMFCTLILSENMVQGHVLGQEQINSDISFSNIVLRLFNLIMSALIGQGFITVGYIYSIVNSKLHELRYINCIRCCLVILLLVIDAKLFCLNAWLSDLHYAEIYNPGIYIICSLCGSIGILELSQLVTSLNYSNAFLSFSKKNLLNVGSSSIIIMLTHKEYLICYFVNIILSKILNTINSIYFFILSLLFVLFIELIVIAIVRNTMLKKLFYYPF